MGPENTVGTAAGEAQGPQGILELQDIVSVEMGHAQIQGAIPQAEGRIDERRPQPVAHLPALWDTGASAESEQGLFGVLVENAIHLGGIQEAQFGELPLDIFDRGTGIVFLDEFHWSYTLLPGSPGK